MKKHDWLLLSIKEFMEPIQIQKAMFKFAMESGARKKEVYPFIPYNWGPCSIEIYDDLSQLREENLIEFVPSGRGWNVYHLTRKGENKSEALEESADSKLVGELDRIRKYVVERDFETLLSDIYTDYPEFIEESLFEV